jgi:eukaryotic-like serine/threonine-protein kinase
MSRKKILHTELADLATSGLISGGGELPDDLLRDATRRLSLVCAVWAGLCTVGIIVNNFVAPRLHLNMTEIVPWSGPANIIAGACILLSVGLWYYARQLWCNPRLVLDLALVYQVILALAIGLINQWYPRILAGRLSWICVLILVFPMIVPNTPRKTLVASLIAASMDPFGIWIASLRGLETPGAALVLWAYVPNYVCALLALLPSKIIARLGRQVRHARELGSYQLEELIGRGGMGEVWRATHRLLARPAAIKLINPEALVAHGRAAGADIVRRFRREAEAASWLQSPHTIHLYDFGETRDRTFYFVMELLDGVDLETLVRRYGPIPSERVVYLLRQACESLAEAHTRGLIHRDIKPANLFLCRVGLEHDFIKVLDFGLVKFDDSQPMLDTLKTAPQATTGTPAYMAPEMAGGEAVDHRADLYALGCVGYWLLTGKVVFEADSPIKMLIQQIQAEPIPPAERLGTPVAPMVERVILDCLKKNPAERPADALELIRRLDECAVDARWTPERARIWWQTHLGDPALPRVSVTGTRRILEETLPIAG